MKPQDSIFLQSMRHTVLNQIAADYSISPRVIEAMKAVPRHYFVDYSQQEESYDDRPLPIASGQTISQITTVALQTHLLDAKPGMKVLEIGGGSGYQAAILAKLDCKVFSIERIEELYEVAQANVAKLDPAPDVNFVFGDGFEGLPQNAPFDRILVTCGATSVPNQLVGQLAIGGKMVVPVGVKLQEMLVIERTDEDQFSTTSAGHYSFVPMLTGVVRIK